MTADATRAADQLTRRYCVDYPLEAARRIEDLDPEDLIAPLARQPARVLAPVWSNLLPETGARLLVRLPVTLGDALLAELPPHKAVRVLSCMAAEDRQASIARLDPAIGRELDELADYPPDSAGRLMNTAVATYRHGTTVAQLLERLGERGMLTARSLFLVDDANRLTGKVLLQDVARVSHDTKLGVLERPVAAMVRATDPVEEVTRAFEIHRVLDLPVIDFEGVFLGAVTHEDLAHTVQEQASVDIQTMVGAGKEERALSSPYFTVRRRMPWLQINLLTAFLAAAVVGLFESTIAQVTALAVLLPVVAGQSGNAGAQALAVTMRGLALREITARQWLRVMRKEVAAGLINGIGIAVTCGIGVFLWSRSLGLVAVISISMILAMVAAGFAGALIPIALTRLGQDPATSSSIVLTTVTDIAGFFSFLGIATLLMGFLT
jgi:magnesium transporter